MTPRDIFADLSQRDITLTIVMSLACTEPVPMSPDNTDPPALIQVYGEDPILPARLLASGCTVRANLQVTGRLPDLARLIGEIKRLLNLQRAKADQDLSQKGGT